MCTLWGVTMKNEILKKISRKDLEKLKEIIKKYQSIDELIENIDLEIKTKKDQEGLTLNEKFDLKMFRKLNILPDDQIEFLRQNKILNLQDLIDCNIDELINNEYSRALRDQLIFIREFYDMTNVEKIDTPRSKPKQLTKRNK